MKLGIASFLGVLLSATPSLATPEIATQQEVDDHADLVVLINRLGVDVLFDHKFVCQQQRWWGAYATDGSELILCENAKSSPRERLTTIRHESWHVYQDLKDCKLTDITSLSPVFTTGTVPESYIKYASRNYDKADVPAEAEAYWAEGQYSAKELSDLIAKKAKHCSIQL